MSPLYGATGKLHGLPGGLYGIAASLPERVFLPYRRAGKTPWQPDVVPRIMADWEPDRNRQEQEALLAEYGMALDDRDGSLPKEAEAPFGRPPPLVFGKQGRRGLIPDP